MPLLQQNDALFAYKALAIMPDLSAASRRVAGAIIDHFNKKTGQCDPSVGRLTKLLRISRAAVLRATKELDELGLIQKQSHGGKSHRTAYLPNWQMFRAVVEDWDHGMKSGDRPSEGLPKVSELKPSTSQSCDHSGLKNETQTRRKNPSNKPIERNSVASRAQIDNLPNKSIKTDWSLKGKGRKEQVSFFHSPQHAKTPSRSEVARAKAQQRWEGDLMRRRHVQTEAIIAWLTLERMDQATEAELSRQGGGLDFILKEMRLTVANAS
ncbi:helix-turn-helix domain-containing protein [Roseibium sediminis]|uniref:helix-turn-helix domain-containing protein n=1 Tax=Roseibium sediminis TaxID=1775174 RepID=UPI00123D444F|nr:helix-turn-helix domain-containing protein [Roseibium sediminis]